MDRETARRLAASVAWGRIGLGATAVLAPAIPLRPWVGREVAWRPRAKLLARALGFRDIALGVGAVMALHHDGPVRGWVEGGALADAGDVLATLIAFGTLPKWGRWLVLGSAASAVAASGLAVSAVDS